MAPIDNIMHSGKERYSASERGNRMMKKKQFAGSCMILLSVVLLAGVCRTPAYAVSFGDATNSTMLAKASKPKDTEKADANVSENLDVKLPPWTGPKKRLGIMDMDVKVTATSSMQPTSSGGATSTTTLTIPPPTDFGTGLSEMLTTALIDTNRFVLLERKALADIQAEQALAASGAVDPATATGNGKILGAQALIRGAVTEYSYNSSSKGGTASFLKGISIAVTTSEAMVGLDIRIYDAATGQILDSVRAEGKAKSSATAMGIDRDDWKVGGSSFKQSPLGAATRQAISRAVVGICKRMDVMPWEGRIADIDTNAPLTLYLNAGAQSGMKQGMQLEIVRPGRPIKDPETATIIGRTKDTHVGICEIKQCMEKLSLAEPIEGKGFKIGDCVHLLNWTGPVQPASAATDAEAQPTPAPGTQPTN